MVAIHRYSHISSAYSIPIHSGIMYKTWIACKGRAYDALARCRPKELHDLPNGVTVPQPVLLRDSEQDEEHNGEERRDPLAESNVHYCRPPC